MAKFKTRARALDLLGRQQIAGIPTAINELFKNAHDAYADNVDVDYFRNNNLFVLRDNGLGMTKDDFENRWLVLGTESKLESNNSNSKRVKPPVIDTDKPLRPSMGEKGIGRLAIAAIGKQVLIITRAKRKDELEDDYTLKDAVAVFINWRVFEIPGLDLDDVVIPLREYENGKIPNKNDIDELKLELSNSIKNIHKKGYLNKEEVDLFLAEINDFSINPLELGRQLPGDLSLDKKSGTHFYISPVSEMLNKDISESEKGTPSNLEKFLIGFTNTMTPNHRQPNIEATFRDYKSNNDAYDNLINKETFFTPNDFKIADHRISGEFDEYGQFKGDISIYNEYEIQNHIIPWGGNNYSKTSCGSFKIDFFYIHGVFKHSSMGQIDWNTLIEKTNKFGGLYLLRDGIRVLPYGGIDYDWLEIEKRRNKSFSHAFFSHRRMFGIVQITREKNSKLTEKSGREGFIENKAYRQMKSILMHFLDQIAQDFFRESSDSSHAEVWAKKRRERVSDYKTLQAREKRVKAKKQKFNNELDDFFQKTSSGEIDTEVKNLLIQTEKELKSLVSIKNLDRAAQFLIKCEIDSKEKLDLIKKQLKISFPRGFSINKDLQKQWEIYLDRINEIEVEIFLSTEKKLTELIEYYQELHKIEVSKRKRIQQALEQTSIKARLITKEKTKEADELIKEVKSKYRKLTQDLMTNLENKIREAQSNLSTLDVINEEDIKLFETLKEKELPIVREQEYASEILENIIEQIDSIYWEKDSSGKIVTNKQIEASLVEEIEEIKEKSINDAELIQLGLALNIVHHEFGSAVKSLRYSIRDLRRRAVIDETLDKTYNGIRTSFEHLDGYLSLLTPFNRRLYRKAENIKGEDIYIFLKDVFQSRLDRHHTSLKRTKAFAASSVKAYRSTIYPVFVNVVDNAIHWLKHKTDNEEKIIRLHYGKEGIFYISNNGPEIRELDKERIFELNFSRKENGRGMGLAISKQVLNAIDYDIIVDEPRKKSTVTFKIYPINQE